MGDKHMPARIYAFRYHPDNQRERSRGAWDDRTSFILKDDVAYVRADLTTYDVMRWINAEAALKAALPVMRLTAHEYLQSVTIKGDPATIAKYEWAEICPDILAILKATDVVGPQPDQDGVDTEWLDRMIAAFPRPTDD